MLKPHCFNENWEPVTKKKKKQNNTTVAIFQSSKHKVNLAFLNVFRAGTPARVTQSSEASPQRGVVELDPQQVLHAGLGWVVDDVLVVQEGVSVVITHPGLYPGAHRHRHAVSAGTKRESRQALWLLGS